MEFCLYYRGRLTSNGDRREKHDLRIHFSRQLNELWRQKTDRPDQFIRLLPDIAKDGWSEAVGPLRVASLVTAGQVAELSITLLRPEAPGSIVSRGGDIDNRLKTLLDGLRRPLNADELPAEVEPSDDVLLCLLEDDKLVTHLSVQTEQLLEPDAGGTLVVLLIKVVTKRLSDLEAHITHRGMRP